MDSSHFMQDELLEIPSGRSYERGSTLIGEIGDARPNSLLFWIYSTLLSLNFWALSALSDGFNTCTTLCPD